MSARRGAFRADQALEINRFWFGPAPLGVKTVDERRQLWFGIGSAARQAPIGAMIRERFGAHMARAAAGELDGWTASPHRALALILLLDLLPRNAFTGTPRAFSTDARALALALSALQAAADAALSPLERVFLYMPLQHAERLDAQEESVSAYRRVLHETPGELRPFLAEMHALAQRQHAIIARFGRFPERNPILARPSTAEEIAFLAGGTTLE
jgi:uncharacterized protein (DUF924 family)